jgi:hypothetical protein
MSERQPSILYLDDDFYPDASKIGTYLPAHKVIMAKAIDCEVISLPLTDINLETVSDEWLTVISQAVVAIINSNPHDSEDYCRTKEQISILREAIKGVSVVVLDSTLEGNVLESIGDNITVSSLESCDLLIFLQSLISKKWSLLERRDLAKRLVQAHESQYHDDERVLCPADSSTKTITQYLRMRLSPAECKTEEYDRHLRNKPIDRVRDKEKLQEELNKLKNMSSEGISLLKQMMQAKHMNSVSIGQNVGAFAIDLKSKIYREAKGYGVHKQNPFLLRDILLRTSAIWEDMGLSKMDYERPEIITALVYDDIESFDHPIIKFDNCDVDLFGIARWIIDELGYIPVDYRYRPLY